MDLWRGFSRARQVLLTNLYKSLTCAHVGNLLRKHWESVGGDRVECFIFLLYCHGKQDTRTTCRQLLSYISGTGYRIRQMIYNRTNQKPISMRRFCFLRLIYWREISWDFPNERYYRYWIGRLTDIHHDLWYSTISGHVITYFLPFLSLTHSMSARTTNFVFSTSLCTENSEGGFWFQSSNFAQDSICARACLGVCFASLCKSLTCRG